MSDSESDASGIQEWALVENQDEAQDSEGSNDFVSVEDTRCVSYHHKTPLQEPAASIDENAAVVQEGPAELEEVGSSTPTTADTSSVTDSVTMTAAVAQDEADSVTSSYSLEELSVPAGDGLSQSSSSLEELSLPTEDVEDVGMGCHSDGAGPSGMERMSKELLNGSREEQMDCSQWQSVQPERSLLSSVRMRNPSGSDTDHSDFVRLDQSQSDEVSGDLMHLSSTSSVTAASSVSSTFRFIHRSDMVLGEEPARRVYYRDNDEDSVPSDIDDRCESDISGVAGDDSDLSNLTYSLGDVPIAAGNVARSYKHRPNNSLNATLTTIALMALFFALGIGLGDFIGFHRQAGLRLQQVNKLRSLQDDYLICLQQQEESSQMLVQQQKDNELIQAVTEEWKQQYEELILERVALEAKIEDLHSRMKTDAEAGRELLSEMEGNSLSDLIDGLESQTLAPTPADTALVTTEAVGTMDTQEEQADLVPQQKETSTDLVVELQAEVETLNEEKGKLMFEMKLMQYDILSEKESLQKLEEQLQEKLATNITAQLQLEVDSLEKQKEELMFQMDLMRYSVLSEKQTLEQLQMAATEKLERFHQLAMENEDLRKEVARLRYSEHPGNSVGTADSGDTVENLKLMISRLEKDVEDMQKSLQSLTENLHKERKSAAKWQEHFVEKSLQLDEVLSKSPDIATCLSFMIPAFTLGDISHASSDALRNLSEFVSKRIEVIQKLADDSDFLKVISKKWEMLRTMLSSPLAEEVQDQTMAAYEEIRRIVMDKFEALGGVVFETTDTDAGPDENSEDSGEEINSYHTRLHRMVNQTKETVTKLTKKINQTWEKVRDVSGHVTKKVVNDIVPLMKAEVGKWKGKVQHGWDTVRSKVENGLLSKKGKKKMKKEGKHSKGTGKRQSEVKRRMSEEDRRQYHRDPYSSEEEKRFDDTFTQASHQFEHKPEHKQKTSDIHIEKGPQIKLSEKMGFSPDDLLHDGFFEGNERKWRKHQKVLKKLHGRINRLNEDILHDMDDDDIEDLYEDLEDFQDDIEDEVQPMGLKTWLTCQLRWWKGRFQRKHRSEDLIKGCGRQLMHWQVKASCEVRGQKELVSDPACLQYFPHRSVIRAFANGASSKRKMKPNYSRKTTKDCSKHCKTEKKKDYERTCRNEKMERKSKTVRVSNEELWFDNLDTRGSKSDETSNFFPMNNQGQNDTNIDYSADWWFQREQQRENHHVPGEWYWKRRQNHHTHFPAFPEESWISQGEDTEADANWYFTHAEVREFYHHDPRWIFGRAREREFHRDKPWYMARAEKRNNGHERNYKDD